MTLGERIRERRTACGLSQEKAAELVGVSRQAVTKWERGQAAPSTENLFKLAQVFGTTVDLLLEEGTSEGAESRAEDLGRKERWKERLLAGLAVAGAYLGMYLVCLILTGSMEGQSVLGWLLVWDFRQVSYLFGWLLTSRMFWLAMGVCVLGALLGKRRFSAVSSGGCALGILLGHWLGPNPSGAAVGNTDKGWLVWGAVFLFSLVMGGTAQQLGREKLTLRMRQGRLWLAAYGAGVILLVLLTMGH